MKTEQIEAYIHELAARKTPGVDMLTLADAQKVVSYCQANDFTILAIDGFRDYGEGRIGASLDLNVEYSRCDIEDFQDWENYRNKVNTFALRFLTKLQEVEQAEKLRILVEILVQAPLSDSSR